MTAANIANTKVVPVSTTSTPYYDDFDESKNFHRVLIRPGYAVQARELTQLQTILQNQIERFGNHIFTNGSLVAGGQISVDYGISLNLQQQFVGTDVDVDDFLGKTITYSSANTSVQAKVVGVTANTGNGVPVLTIKYLTGREFVEDDVIKVDGEEVYANIASANANNIATLASVDDGIFFINGFFVKTPSQTIVVDKYSNRANAKIGLEFTNDIVDEGSDTSLLDPAQESSNYQAPGATRLRIELELAKRSLSSTDDEQFIELLRIEDGTIKKKVIYPIYGAIEDTLARRTYDESGSYTVRPYRLSLKEHPTDANSLLAVLDPGKAYVYGYEHETIAQEYITVPRAQDTTTIENYDILGNFGNYVIVGDIRGLFDTSTMQIMDIHCVNWQNVSNSNISSGAPYRSTKIGTTRLRALHYETASNSANVLTRTYRAFIFDTQFSNLTSNVSSATSNSLIIYDPVGTAKFSNTQNAYVGATVRITSGLGVGQTFQVSDYTQASAVKNLKFSTAFTTTPNNQSQFALEFDFGEAESFVAVGSSGNTGPNTEWTRFNITTASKSDGTETGTAGVSESTLQSLVFPFPQDYIKETSITVPNYQYQRVFTGVTFTSGSGEVSVTDPEEAFQGSGGSGTSTAVLDNFVITVTNKQASGRANGEIVSPSTISMSSGGGSQTATIETGNASESFIATVISAVNINSGTKINPKSKTLYTGNTTVFNPASAGANGSFQQATPDGTSNTVVYLNAGQALIINPSKTPNWPQTLFVSDLKTVTKIYDLNGTTPGPASGVTGNTDVTSRFTIDTGQRDTHYDFGTITLKSGVASPRGPLLVCYNWYDHVSGTSDGSGFFTVDSYPAANTPAGYADIPTYATSDGSEIPLRDAIDFRPRRQNASNTTPAYTFQGVRIPNPNENISFDSYQYYLARRDKLALTKDRKFKLIQGVSALLPQEPSDIGDSMVLYRLYLPPYTLYAANVDVTYVENKRYTMRDIGVLEKRIENLEYYTSLSLLENDTVSLTITDVDGLERTKHGILVDGFSGHAIGDVTNNDYDCAMDYEEGALVPRNKALASKLFVAANTNAKVSGQITTLAYTEEVFVSQNLATKAITVQPYMFATFAGSIQMNPDSDTWVDTRTVPTVVTNPSGSNDNFVSPPPAQIAPETIQSQTTANNVPDPLGGRRRWWRGSHRGVSVNTKQNLRSIGGGNNLSKHFTRSLR